MGGAIAAIPGILGKAASAIGTGAKDVGTFMTKPMGAEDASGNPQPSGAQNIVKGILGGRTNQQGPPQQTAQRPNPAPITGTEPVTPQQTFDPNYLNAWMQRNPYPNPQQYPMMPYNPNQAFFGR